MSINSEITRLQGAKSDLKTSIANKGVTVPSATTLDGYATLVDQISTTNIQSLSVTENGAYAVSGNVNGYSPITVNVPSDSSALDVVRFFDYDGTLLHSYTANEFAALNAMPANPTHTGLTSQGWNWTLANAKAQVTATGTCDIGQMYVTSDGKTRIYISLVDSARLSPYLGICPNGTVVVNWGDNTATTTLTGTSLTTVKRAQHTYASTGNYVITLSVTKGTFAIYGQSGTNGSYLLTRTNSNNASQKCYQNAIKKVELGTNVSVGQAAFYECYSLTNITMPSSVTDIGNDAFYRCVSLTSITIPNGVTIVRGDAFCYCYSLLSVTIPKSVTWISDYAFEYCSSLTSITIPNSVTRIGNDAFSGCDFSNIVIPNSVTRIADPFYNCPRLSNITIPSSVTSIGPYGTFYMCPILTVTLPNNTTNIGMRMFGNCYSLISITIPSSVTNIGEQAFYSCTSLANIIIPSGVTSIGENAFNRCRSLASITIPSSVTSIGKSAFSQCYSLPSITIPNGVTTINENTFYRCYSLTSITIPSSVTSIGKQAFSGCQSLVSITIPSGVTSIGASAFSDNISVAEYHLLPTTPPTLDNTNAFNNILDDCKIYVPSASLTAYQEATNWSTYASYMIGE